MQSSWAVQETKGWGVLGHWERRIDAVEIALRRAGRADLMTSLAAVRRLLAAVVDEDDAVNLDHARSLISHGLAELKACVLAPARGDDPPTFSEIVGLTKLLARASAETIVPAPPVPPVRVLMKGELVPGLLFDLIQLFAQNGETGRLIVEGDAGEGIIHFASGAIVDAERGGAVGEEAFFQLVTVKAGRFVYERGGHVGPVRIERSPQQLIADRADKE